MHFKPPQECTFKLPGKPLKIIAGKPLVFWVIKAALKVKNISKVILATDHAEILKVGSEVGSPRELHLLRPDRIQIKGGGKPIPDRYEYIVNGRVQNVFDVDQDTGSSEIKHIKLWNPLDDYYGCSPLQAAAEEVDQHNLSLSLIHI